jgi:outer membrane protein OmpA-like peptidoglycan-associated protein
MVTLLLTFFVMLLSLAKTQRAGLFYAGRESFLLSIRSLGLGVLYGKKPAPQFGNVKIKYFISSPDQMSEGRTIHAREEELRRIFKKIDRSLTTMPSQIVAQKTNFSVTNIRFAPGDSTLNEPAKRFLTEFCAGLQQDPESKGVTLYVLGLASDVATEKGQWILSARRAQAAADFLQDTLSPGARSVVQDDTSAVSTRWPVYSWGAGPGGNWVDQDSPISRQSQILIAVLRAND